MKEPENGYNKAYFPYVEDEESFEYEDEIDNDETDKTADEIDEMDEINEKARKDLAVAGTGEQTSVSSIDSTPLLKEGSLSKENDRKTKMTDKLLEKEETEGRIIMSTPTCATGLSTNCGECCAIFTDTAKRAAFGYQVESATCECHDICVEDVRDICVKRRTLRYCVPCNPDGRAGCRGGFLPDGPPTVQSWRVLCAEERLSPGTGCDRIINELEFEVVLRFGSTMAVVTPRDTFDCFWYEFAKFPSGVFFPNSTAGLNQFRNELAVIDGSCKVIIIEAVRVVTDGNDCILEIVYKVIDKLWKHENLLVSAIKPYAPTGEAGNVTVKQEFGQGHSITACTGSGPCGGL